MTILPPFLLITFIITAYDAVESTASPETAANGSTGFIRTSCNTTLYPEVCYKYLYGFANVVKQDPARLAAVAISVSLSRTTLMSIYVANLTREASYVAAQPRAAAALLDCFHVYRDAVSLIRGSMKQMRQLSGGGEELKFEMSNVQTWMSAALTNQDTCTEGFEGVPDCPLKADVCDRTVEVEEVTSNALALVNSFVDKIVVP